jgi:AcrR family transcriptional regulator
MPRIKRTRRDIVDRALALAADVGLENVTLGVLATDLDLSKSGLFAHFKSKEALQLSVLAEAIERFTAVIVRPALAAPRGEPRVVALFENKLAWITAGGGVSLPVAPDGELPRGRCIFMALSQEYDDRPGPVRDAVVQSQRDWRATLAHAARIAVDEGHFRADLDVEQFAFEFLGICMTYQQTHKLLADDRAEGFARAAFDALLARSRRRKG